MIILVVAFISGVLTIAAPCILPLLPVIVGGSIEKKTNNTKRALIVTGSLVVSVVVFTLLLKSITSFLVVPNYVWQVVSGVIVIALGSNYLFPRLWEAFSSKTKIYTKSNAVLGRTFTNNTTTGAVLTGFALGPVFNSCSPTYAFIVASVLPVSFAQGFAYLLAYALGLGMALLAVALAGQIVVQKLGWITNPNGWFSKVIGAVFIVVGFSVLFGLDKQAQTYILERGWYAPISGFENRFRN
jgi:cytochrome c biogenesis protein CcdA